MSERFNEEYDAQNRALIERESRKLDNARDKAAALEKNTSRTLAKLMRARKQALAREAGAAVRRGESGMLSPMEQAMVRAAQSGGLVTGVDEGPITGLDPLPWDEDSEDF